VVNAEDRDSQSGNRGGYRDERGPPGGGSGYRDDRDSRGGYRDDNRGGYGRDFGRGGGRGRGRGRGRPTYVPEVCVVISCWLTILRDVRSRVEILANHFRVDMELPAIHQYRIDTEPVVAKFRVRRALLGGRFTGISISQATTDGLNFD